jgi:hypothetical protein
MPASFDSLLRFEVSLWLNPRNRTSRNGSLFNYLGWISGYYHDGGNESWNAIKETENGMAGGFGLFGLSCQRRHPLAYFNDVKRELKVGAAKP